MEAPVDQESRAIRSGLSPIKRRRFCDSEKFSGVFKGFLLMFRTRMIGIALLVFMICLALALIYLFSGAYRVGLKSAVVPAGTYPWVRGKWLLDRSLDEIRSKYGFKIIHQSWKTTYIPKGTLTKNFVSSFHRQALHVLWTDSDNYNLLTEHYPQFQGLYKRLALNVQWSDVMRLLYLHRFGGLYVDLDYEAKANIFDALPVTDADLMIVRSPAMINEVMQNSLMISKHLGHDFWHQVVVNIGKIQSLLDGECLLQPPQSCINSFWFHNPLTKTVASMILTSFVSGPAVLDKTLPSLNLMYGILLGKLNSCLLKSFLLDRLPNITR